MTGILFVQNIIISIFERKINTFDKPLDVTNSLPHILAAQAMAKHGADHA
jgi:hypothetical protein